MCEKGDCFSGGSGKKRRETVRRFCNERVGGDKNNELRAKEVWASYI